MYITLTQVLWYSTKNFTVFLILFFSALTVSCTQSRENAANIERQKKLVLELHDDSMLALPIIKRINKALLMELKDSTLALDSVKLLRITSSNLAEADKAMWDWMHQFDISYQHENDSLVLVYFNEQYSQLLNVMAKMDSAILVGERRVISYERAQ